VKIRAIRGQNSNESPYNIVVRVNTKHPMKTKTSPKNIILFTLAGAALLGLNSCLPLVAGAAAGYVAHDEGYRVTNPIKKVEE
jgi:hypothetical protein